MTTDTPEAPARPDSGRAAPAEPVARGVARIGRADELPARGRASVPGAINPALRHAPPYVAPPRRERPARSPQAEPGRAEPPHAEPRRPEPQRHDPAPADPAPADPAPAKLTPAQLAATPAVQRHGELLAHPGDVGAKPTGQSFWPPKVESSLSPVLREKPAWPPPAGSAAKLAWPSLPAEKETGADQSTERPAPNPEVREEPEVRRRGRGVLLPLAAGVLAAFVAGTGYLAVNDRPITDDIGRWTRTPPAAAPSTAASDDAPFAVPAEGSTADPFGIGAQTVTGLPTRLKIKAIGIDTTLETLRLGSGGALTPPKNFAKAGFYADGALPGDVGPAIIAGHVDSKRGPAVFYKLREMQAGDKVQVVRGGRTLTFTVTSVVWYPKTKFPTAEVYGPTPDRQLRLITCGGVFDHSLRSYKDNLVVYAVAG